jgi:hypothetical protein
MNADLAVWVGDGLRDADSERDAYSRVYEVVYRTWYVVALSVFC